jgi:hypothetical protein
MHRHVVDQLDLLGKAFQMHLLTRATSAARTSILRYLSSWAVALYQHGTFDAAICFVALARAKSLSMLRNVIIQFTPFRAQRHIAPFGPLFPFSATSELTVIFC